MLKAEYDLRGILNKDLSWQVIETTVKNFLKDIRAKEILVASDFNRNNLKIKQFIEKKFQVKNLGILPTPIFYYEVIQRKTPGIMITASHLPLKYSGLKFLLEDGTAWKPKVKNREFGIKNLEFRIKKEDLRIKQKLYKDYFQKLKSTLKPKKKIFVEFDLNNFFLKTSLPYFKKLNILHKKNSLIKIKADFDNDRIYLFYKKKKILADLIFYSLALSKKYQKLGVPIFFSQFLKNLLLKNGKKIFFIKTGHYYFKNAFKKYNLDLAFEPTGHFYMFKDLKTEAPYLALALFLHKENLEKLISKHSLSLYRFDLSPISNLNLEKIAISLKNKFGLKLRKFDGYFLSKKNFYLHFRPSKTENKIRLSFEGDKNYLKEIKKWFRKQ